MRSFEFLTEKVIDLGKTLVYQNPSNSAIKNLIKKHKELRGFVGPDKQHFVWDSWAATHQEIAYDLGYEIDFDFLVDGLILLMFVTDFLEDIDWNKDRFRFNGEFYVGSTYSDPKNEPALARYFPR